ncbi:MAG: hypothetical protein V4615_10875 [Bacteroidota bacterium]
MKEKLLEAFRNWNPEITVTVKIKFVKKGTNTALTGQQYIVRLYDKDIFTDDDYLGHSGLNDNGEAHIHFFPSDIFNSDLGFETLPDLYVLLFDGDIVHYQSKVWDNVDFEKLALLDIKEGEVINFGTFLID